MSLRLSRKAAGAALIFLVACKSPTPPAPPAKHGAIITIQEEGTWDHFIIYRGQTCTVTAMIATIKALSYTDNNAPAGSNCYMAAAVAADGTLSRRSNTAIVTVQASSAVLRIDAGAAPTWGKK